MTNSKQYPDYKELSARELEQVMSELLASKQLGDCRDATSKEELEGEIKKIEIEFALRLKTERGKLRK
jgi:hypothetical protein